VRKLAGIVLLLAAPVLFAQPAAGQRAGTLVVTSGGRDADKRFVQLAGSRDANIVYLPAAASSLRSTLASSGILMRRIKRTSLGGNCCGASAWSA
jgi:hypothetical protein